MSEILKEIKKLRKEVKEVKNILTDETSRDYVQALIDNNLVCNYSGLPSTKSYGDNSSIKNEELSQEYLDQWTCEICGEHTHEVEYDYLGNNRNHLGCELREEINIKHEIAAMEAGVDVTREKN
jgi:hypothetical protein